MRWTFVALCSFGLFWACGGYTCVYAKQPALDLVCQKLFAKRAYAQAGDCFSRALPASSKTIPKPARTSVGRRIRNAVTSYRKAALAAKPVGKRAYMAARAVALLTRYLGDKLYENKFRKDSALLLRYQLLKQVGYTQVTILAGHPADQIELVGYQFRKKLVGRQWSGRLRQGRYRVIVLSPKRPQPFSSTLRARPGAPVFLQIPAPPSLAKVPKPRKRLPSTKAPPRSALAGRLAVGLLVTAGVLGATSAVLLASGSATEAERDNLHQQNAPGLGQVLTQESIEVTRQINGLQGLGGGLYTSSLVLAIVGGAALVGGGVSLFLYVRSPTPPPATKAAPLAVP